MGKKGVIPSQVRYRIAGCHVCISFAYTGGYAVPISAFDAVYKHCFLFFREKICNQDILTTS